MDAALELLRLDELHHMWDLVMKQFKQMAALYNKCANGRESERIKAQKAIDAAEQNAAKIAKSNVKRMRRRRKRSVSWRRQQLPRRSKHNERPR